MTQDSIKNLKRTQTHQLTRCIFLALFQIEGLLEPSHRRPLIPRHLGGKSFPSSRKPEEGSGGHRGPPKDHRSCRISRMTGVPHLLMVTGEHVERSWDIQGISLAMCVSQARDERKCV